MNYLKKGLLRTLKAIKEHKWLFVTLILLQLIFLASAIYLLINYEIKIIENAKGIIEPLQNANYDAESIKQGNPFTKEMWTIYNNYLSMMKNVKEGCVLFLFLYLFLNGSIWILTHHLLEKEKLSRIPQMVFKLIVSTLLLIGPLAIISNYFLHFFLQMEISSISLTTMLNIIFYISIIVYYFLISAFAVINYSSWRGFLKKFFENSIKKIYKYVLVLLINLSLIVGSIYTIYLAVNYEQSLFLLLASGLLLVLILVLTRIFWVACHKEHCKEIL